MMQVKKDYNQIGLQAVYIHHVLKWLHLEIDILFIYIKSAD